MPQHVLVPVDGSDHAFAGLEYSLESFPDATLTALYVVDPTLDHEATVGSSAAVDRAEDRGEQILDSALEQAADHGRELQTALRTGVTHKEILAMADSDADHVVMGSHGESPLTRPFLGHVSEAVVRRSTVSTTVVSETMAGLRNRELPGTILVPLDGSEQAEAALEYALETFPDSECTVFHALSLPFDRPRSDVTGTYLEDILDDREARAERIFDSATALADDRGRTIETETGADSPGNAIINDADENDYDQIIMGSHGGSFVTRRLTGSVAERVVRRSTRAVTLVRGTPAD